MHKQDVCPKFSILTPSFNQGQYISENIESVIAQNSNSFEHIIIDGGSGDQTVEVLKQYPHLRWISEKDGGQADALNKGLAMATGDIVGWINSDDYYFPSIFDDIARCFEDPQVQWVIGDITLMDEKNTEFVPLTSQAITTHSLFKNPDIVRQQSTFFRRDFLNRVGGWNAQYFMVMDFDLWVRLAKLSTPKMLSLQCAVFRVQENQKSGLKNISRQTKEFVHIMRRENVSRTNIFNLRFKKLTHLIRGHMKIYLIRLGFISEKYRDMPVRGWDGGSQ